MRHRVCECSLPCWLFGLCCMDFDFCVLLVHALPKSHVRSHFRTAIRTAVALSQLRPALSQLRFGLRNSDRVLAHTLGLARGFMLARTPHTVF
jgi:uncharacterized membrane protein